MNGPAVWWRALRRVIGAGGASAPGAHASVRALLADPALELVPGAAAGQATRELPTTALVTVTCSPRGKVPATLELCERLVGAGHRVIPHLAARVIGDRSDVVAIAKRLAGLGIDEVFVIAGDAPEPEGPYAGALDLLRELFDVGAELRQAGVAGYPDGHPLLDDGRLHQQLHAKQALLAEVGVPGWVSTQMCFDPQRVVTWLEHERAQGLALPVRLGVPGVVDRTRLIRMGTRLGVGASLRFASKQGGAVARLIAPGGYDPLQLVEPVSDAAERLGIERLHVFTFNSVRDTVAWRDALLR